MKIIAFIEAHQGEVIRNILEHRGFWHDPPCTPPPHESRPCRAVQEACQTDGITVYEVDPDFLEFAWCEQTDQPELPLRGLRQFAALANLPLDAVESGYDMRQEFWAGSVPGIS